uniref:Uncharacterized protein n=1 Tax=Haptolina brevifila TaxID=156173 RepID=A0A7S2J5K8_9EUKA|mmetsp:Transcript_76424/g.151488  ORF Transcript_76424/g.151488 Transcript_76424/m.151488 type:complete len:128 (+) Transcript_76424:407-790(+)
MEEREKVGEEEEGESEGEEEEHKNEEGEEKGDSLASMSGSNHPTHSVIRVEPDPYPKPNRSEERQLHSSMKAVTLLKARPELKVRLEPQAHQEEVRPKPTHLEARLEGSRLEGRHLERSRLEGWRLE